MDTNSDPLLCTGNLVSNADFEAGLAPWQSNDASLAASTEARSGVTAARACRLADGSNRDFGLRMSIARTPPVGKHYRLSAFVRSESALSGRVHMRLRANGADVEEVFGTSTPLTTSWTRVELDHTVGTPNGDEVLIDVQGLNAPPDPMLCLDVDDVCLIEQ